MRSVDARLEAKRTAYLELADWAKQASERRRNDIIVRAHAAGIPAREIGAIVGLHKARVYQILKEARDAEA